MPLADTGPVCAVRVGDPRRSLLGLSLHTEQGTTVPACGDTEFRASRACWRGAQF